MLAPILGSRCWQDDLLAHKVDLAPLQLSYFIPALACEQEQAHNLAKVIIAKAAPQLAQLLLR
jgi:hypothetical protein